MPNRAIRAGLLALVACAVPALAQDLPRGQIVDDVKCAGDPSQSYALYLPSLGQRFAIDNARVYLTGLSGGARVAMQIALGKSRIAGVIASSAGYPDGRPRIAVPFPVFGTAGTEDFNYIEMRMLDRALTTPHQLEIFQGGHALPPDEVAMDAIEWMEVQAMASGARPRDEAVIDLLLAKRQRAIAAAGDSAAAFHLLTALAADFKGLRDVSAAAARAAELAKRKDIHAALARERDDDDAEAGLLDQVTALEAGLQSDAQRVDSLMGLRDLLARLSKQANRTTDSPERGRARRVLRTVTMGASERVQDPDYLKLLDQYRRALGRSPLAAFTAGSAAGPTPAADGTPARREVTSRK